MAVLHRVRRVPLRVRRSLHHLCFLLEVTLFRRQSLTLPGVLILQLM